jgi:serine/threonine-protein kinase
MVRVRFEGFMENRPLRTRPAQMGHSPGAETPDEDADVRDGREETPLPLHEGALADSKDWAELGSTRVIASSLQHPDPPRLDDALSAPTPMEKGQTDLVIGDFRLLQKLGEGAMGAVYKAHQLSFNRDVALKVLFKHVANNPKLVERMYREGLVMGKLDHPNIVRGYGIGEDQGWHYIAMELIDGESLQKWLDRVGRLGLGNALHIVLACAAGLQYAHEMDVIHRDIKPDNILITRSGQVKVTDLGMVKMLDEDMSLTQTGHAVGTPWYMPLEQARNAKDTDCRCDIYSLGCMLYCLVTGRPPFTGRTLVEVIQAKEIGTFPPARQFDPEVPERLDLIIAKMTAKLPRYRYQTCAEVINDLEGLGLASPRLELSPQTDRRAVAAKTTPASLVEPAPVEDQNISDVWYVRYKKSGGQVVVRKLTTAEVLQMLENPAFDPTAKASRRAREGFRALATYREFEHLALGRVSKSIADKQTVRYRSLYKKIEDQERERDEKKEQENTTSAYWMGIVLKYSPIVIGVCLGFLLLYYLANGLGN